MTKKEAWKYLEKLWETPKVDVEGNYWIEFEGVYCRGLCKCLLIMKNCNYINYATYLEMFDAIEARLQMGIKTYPCPGGAYAWPVKTPEGPKGRKAFCEVQASLCE